MITKSHYKLNLISNSRCAVSGFPSGHSHAKRRKFPFNFVGRRSGCLRRFALATLRSRQKDSDLQLLWRTVTSAQWQWWQSARSCRYSLLVAHRTSRLIHLFSNSTRGPETNFSEPMELRLTTPHWVWNADDKKKLPASLISNWGLVAGVQTTAPRPWPPRQRFELPLIERHGSKRNSVPFEDHEIRAPNPIHAFTPRVLPNRCCNASHPSLAAYDS